MGDRITLARAYVATYDALEGSEHQADLAALRDLDDARMGLVTRIQAREAAYLSAQTLLVAFDEHLPADADSDIAEIGIADMIREIDEYGSVRANGALEGE
jgi:hypothetical protein